MSIIDEIKALNPEQPIYTYERPDTEILCVAKDLIALAESHERLLRAAKALWEHGTALGWKVDEINAAIAEAEKI